MAYSRVFFDFQLSFAARLATKFGLSLDDALFHYTTFSKTLDGGSWTEYLAGLHQASNATAWTYHYYCTHRHPDPTPHDTHYFGHPLFGCFYFVVRDEHTIRPHFVKNDLPEMRPLSRARVASRHAELAQMFAFIQQHVPATQMVLGNSWMYHLEAYRRLYPPAYTRVMPSSTEDEFQFLALWGQCFDSQWQVRRDVAAELIRRVEALKRLDGLGECFPYQILQPSCAVEEFYDFYLNSEWTQ